MSGIVAGRPPAEGRPPSFAAEEKDLGLPKV